MTGELILIGIVVIWGTSFQIVKDVLVTWPPFALLAARFLLAIVPFLPFLLRRGGVNRALLARGTLMGGLLFLGFVLQLLGIRGTTPSRAAFFTAVSVPLVPLFRFAFLGKRPARGTWVALILCGAGIWLLLGRDLGSSIRVGDQLCLACAVAFAWHIIAAGVFTQRFSPVALTGVQLSVAAVLAVAFALAEGEGPPAGAAGGWITIVYLGLVGTSLTFFGHLVGQTRTTVNRTAFIFALEPAVAALYSWLAAGARLGAPEMVGGALLVAAAAIADRPLGSANGVDATR